MIRQVVVEVHDVRDRLSTVKDLLTDQGFSVECERMPELPESMAVTNVYAHRSG
jgi:hypothetical protein